MVGQRASLQENTLKGAPKLEVKTKEGYMSDICPWTYVGQTSHDEGRDTCLFHRIDFPNQTFF